MDQMPSTHQREIVFTAKSQVLVEREQFMNVLHAMLGYMQIALKRIILLHNITFCLITFGHYFVVLHVK